MIKKIIYTVLGILLIGILTQLLSALLYFELHAISRTNLGINWWINISLPLVYLIWSKLQVTAFEKFICLLISSLVGLIISSKIFVDFAIGSIDISTSLIWGSIIYHWIIVPVLQIYFCFFILKTIIRRDKRIKINSE